MAIFLGSEQDIWVIVGSVLAAFFLLAAAAFGILMRRRWIGKSDSLASDRECYFGGGAHPVASPPGEGGRRGKGGEGVGWGGLNKGNVQ